MGILAVTAIVLGTVGAVMKAVGEDMSKNPQPKKWHSKPFSGSNFYSNSYTDTYKFNENFEKEYKRMQDEVFRTRSVKKYKELKEFWENHPREIETINDGRVEFGYGKLRPPRLHSKE